MSYVDEEMWSMWVQ